MMDTETVALELPPHVYADLQSLALESGMDPVEMLMRWVAQARQRREWIQGWEELADLIRQEGGLQVGTTKDQVVEQMRRTRQEIFEAEYAHLYR
ncbi:MAG: hypothetical protein JXA37_08720 [Chloroflexia bacterium]|nr:hypothetical protein [Chloroflexia bacterium]